MILDDEPEDVIKDELSHDVPRETMPGVCGVCGAPSRAKYAPCRKHHNEYIAAWRKKRRITVMMLRLRDELPRVRMEEADKFTRQCVEQLLASGMKVRFLRRGLWSVNGVRITSQRLVAAMQASKDIKVDEPK